MDDRTQEDMPYDNDTGKQYRAGGYLGSDFDQVLLSGDAAELRAVFASHAAREIAEKYSVRMAAHDFLVEQKNQLAILNEEVDMQTDPVRVVREYILTMDQLFEETLVWPYAEGAEESRATYLEESLKTMSDEAVREMAHHIADIDVRKLVTVGAIQEWIEEDVRNAIVELLWGTIQNGRQGLSMEAVRQELHVVIAEGVQIIDSKIPGSILRS